jgi:excisionase family DNA binding protein
MQPSLLKPTDLARLLGVSRSWLYDAAKAGRIPSIRIGGEQGPLRFVPEDIERWLDDARAAWTPGRPTVVTCDPVARARGERGVRRVLSGVPGRQAGTSQRRLAARAIASSVATAPAASTSRSRCP